MKLPLLILILFSASVSSTFGQSRRDSLIVFVGERIDVTRDTSSNKTYGPWEMMKDGKDTFMTRRVSISMDGIYRAKYKILKLVFGVYQKDTIEFTAFDHYGKPGFSEYQNVLLYVRIEPDGKLYHEKYQFSDVYMTKKGKWAAPYNSYDYDHEYNKNTSVKPERIEFLKQVSYPTKVKDSNGEEISLSFPSPYYRTVGNKAIAIYGNYIEDLFRLKREGVLKARKVF